MALRIVGVSFGLVQGGSHSSLAQLQPRCENQDTPLGIVTKPQSGRPNNRVSISDRARDFFPPKVSTPVLALFRCVSSGYRALFPQRVKPPYMKLVTQVHLMPRLRMSGVVSPLTHEPSCRVHKQLYLSPTVQLLECFALQAQHFGRLRM